MNLRNAIAEKREITDSPVIPRPIIEVCGDRRVLVEHHRGVLSFSDDHIDVRVSFGAVHICGESLFIHCMTKFQIVIKGQIRSVTLNRSGV